MIIKELKQYIKGYFDISNDLEDEQVARQSIIDGVSFKGSNIIILIIAIIIASLGLNTNSAAVIIGAMLISPLMGPIMGIGLGVGTYDFDLIKRSFRNVAMAAAFSVLASTIYFLISPVSEGRSELLARTSPTIYDVLIGLFGGGAGIVAVASKQKGNAIPGVAIATALMPPLCTAGYGLATWQLHYFFGAFYLFLINSIFIAFATTLGVKIFKFKQTSFIDPVRKKKVRNIVYGIIILTLMPSVYLTFLMLRESYFVNTANNFIEKEFNFPNTQVINKDAYIKDWNKYITVTLIGQKLNIDSLQVAMQTKLEEMGLKGTNIQIQQGFSVSNSPGVSTQSVFKDIYQTNVDKIEVQNKQIDSLKFVLASKERFDSLSYKIAPEIRVLYPEVRDIALSRNVFCNISTNSIDTTNMVLIEYVSPIRDMNKFKQYIEARTGLKDVQIVQSRVLLKTDKKANPSPK
ncbi:MAG: TIGR00341 family protein [Muribaculaceae bacterium]|nr:TIGR00341 family protein [Muribaculaceae bacterium]